MPVLVLFTFTFFTKSFESLDKSVRTKKKEQELISPGTLYSKLAKLYCPLTSI